MSDNIERIRAYHERSKHQLRQYAAGPATLDWDAQPDPFRHFAGTTQLPLPLLKRQLADVRYEDLYRPGRIAPAAWSLEYIAALLELSLGLSAWKQYGPTRWSLRNNPSSGNLHPTEAYVISTDVPQLPAGVYHYRSDEHSLEARCLYPERSSEANPLPDTILLGLSSIHWREAWKYGERAWRYVQLDVGHAIACVRYAAAVLGWQVQRLDQVSDQQLSELLGLDRSEDFARTEAEHPDVLLAISTQGFEADVDVDDTIKALLQVNESSEWHGQANLLDPHPMYEWPVIDEVNAAAERTTASPKESYQAGTQAILETASTDMAAVDVITQRRSAQAYDGQTVMQQTVFYTMLDKLLPREQIPPWDCITHRPRIHPVLFVHRVEGVANGVYALPRHADALSLLQENMHSGLKWERPEGCPEHLPLYLLITANSQRAARTISCHQDIAADSAFSLAMLAEYDHALQLAPWFYRDLYWEAGMLGQVLYLEAEAHNHRATGIGCFFDDATHETLGIGNTCLQDVYHFTVGQPIIDRRLISLPPYGHLKDR